MSDEKRSHFDHISNPHSEIGSWSDWHIASFAARIVGGELKSQVGEVLALQFFPLDRLPIDMFWWHRQHIEDYLAGLGGSGASRQDMITQPGASNRAELYAMRDQSGLSRSEFYHWYYQSNASAKTRRQIGKRTSLS